VAALSLDVERAHLPFLCYFPTFLTGPAFHFKTYSAYIDGSLFFHAQNNPKGGMPRGSDQHKAVWVAFGSSILCIVAHVVLSGFFKIDLFYVEGGLEGNLLWKSFYVHCALSAKRCSYYFAWKLSEGAAILAGMGFNGWTPQGKPLWDGISNIDVLKCEFPENVRALTVFWNIKTSEWLRWYVYSRTSKPGAKQPGYATLLTNITSAFWHGFYPGYYLAFGFASLCIEEARMLRNILRPFFLNEKGEPTSLKFLYDIGGILLAWLTFDVGFGVFAGLSINKSLIFLSQVDYFPVIGAFLLFPILLVLSSRVQSARPIKKE